MFFPMGYKQHYDAPNGEAGSGSQKHGHDAHDLILKVPVGTVVYEQGRENPIADLNAFLDSTYEPAARLAGCDRAELEWR